MSAIILPDIVLAKTLESIVKFLREDLATNDEKSTVLYKLLGVEEDGQPLQMNSYNFFKQAKKIIQTPENLSVNFGYNQEVAKLTSLHILLPSEQGEATIGEDEGYRDEETFNPTTHDKETTQRQFTSTFNSTYQIMITGLNSTEVNLVYNILKSMLLMFYEHLEAMGLMIPTLGGNDIVMQDDLIPVPLYHKVLNLTFKYELTVPKYLKDYIAKNIYQNIRICDPFDEERCVPVKNRGGQQV